MKSKKKKSYPKINKKYKYKILNIWYIWVSLLKKHIVCVKLKSKKDLLSKNKQKRRNVNVVNDYEVALIWSNCDCSKAYFWPYAVRVNKTG